MVGDAGLEPATSCVSSKRSNQAELIAHIGAGKLTMRPEGVNPKLNAIGLGSSGRQARSRHCRWGGPHEPLMPVNPGIQGYQAHIPGLTEH